MTDGRGVRWRRSLRLPAAFVGLAVLAPLTAFLVSAWLFGWKLQPVLSASMEPTYPVGSLLVVEPIDASEVQPGMVVMFSDPGDPARVVTHRAVQRAPGGELAWLTRGDANSSMDAFPVPARSVRGRVRWHLPHVGTIARVLQWPWNFLLLVVLPAGVLVASELRPRRGARSNAGAARLRSSPGVLPS